jgi:hypothetical protein
MVIWVFFETMADDSSSRDYGDGLYTYRDLDNPALSSGVSQWLSDCFFETRVNDSSTIDYGDTHYTLYPRDNSALLN